MKAFNLFLFFVLFSLLSTGYFFSSVNAVSVSHFYAENTVCGITTTSEEVVDIEDGVDFNFEDGHDYLIVATSTWGGAENADIYEINLMHNATLFEGSQQINEPKAGNASCTNDKDLYKYFFWTIWSPVGSEADEDINFNYISLEGSNLIFDDVTIFVMDMENMLENTDWFYDDDTTDTTLDEGTWDTGNPATLSFTPTNNDDNWLIFGEALLGVDDVATNFETRLNFNNDTFTPILSREGEDVGEQLVQTFSRVFTLSNSQVHNFEIESRNDGNPVGTNERLFNSIFAMNLNSFTFFNATYSDDPVTILNEATFGDFNTEIATLDIPDTVTDSTWFLFSGSTVDSDKKKGLRQQLDDTDTIADQTSQTYDFNDGWDNDDLLGFNMATVQNVTSGVQVLDYDGHGDGANDQVVRHISMFGFTLETLLARQVDDIVIWSDNSTIGQLDISPEVNATNNFIIWSDNATIGFSISSPVSDTVFWSDFVNMTFNVSQDAPDDVVIWSDNATIGQLDISPEVNATNNFVIWSDDTEMTFDVSLIVPSNGTIIIDDWCDISPTVCNTDWEFRKTITIDNTQVSGSTNLVNFPFLINFTGSDFTDVEDETQSLGQDIRFTDKEGNILEYEIEQYNESTNDMAIWVKSNSTGISSSVDTEIYMYYGNSGASNISIGANVWDSNYKAVWHLNQTSGTLKDAVTGTTNECINTGLDLDDLGLVDAGVRSDADADDLTCGSDSSLQPSDALTFSIWLRSLDDPVDDKGSLGGIASGTDWIDGYGIWFSKTNKVNFQVSDGIDADQTISTVTDWNYIVGTYDKDAGSDQVKIYINGVIGSKVNTNDQVIFYDGGEFQIAEFGTRNDKGINGFIDEVRISDIARTSDWILTEYNNQKINSSFITVSLEVVRITELAESLTVTWSDFVEMGVTFDQEVTDTIIWNDNSTTSFVASREITDTVIWSDNTEMTFNVSEVVPDDVVIWSDFVEMTLAINRAITDTIIWNDNSTTSFVASREVDDTVIWSDNTEMTFNISEDVPDDVVIWSDFVEMTLAINRAITDTIIWNDNITIQVSVSPVVDDTVIWSDDTEMTFDVSLVVPDPTPPITADWCDISPTACDTDWEFRKLITIDNTKVGGSTNLADFPFLINFTRSDFTDVEDEAQSLGQDIRFTDFEGNLLQWEIEKYDETNDKMAIWVKSNSTGLSSSVDTKLFMYYGNSGATNISNGTDVWDSDYQGVFHYADDDFLDSTLISNGTNSGTTFLTDEFIGDSRDYVGSHIKYNGHDDFGTTSITVSAWVKAITLSGGGAEDTFGGDGVHIFSSRDASLDESPSLSLGNSNKNGCNSSGNERIMFGADSFEMWRGSGSDTNLSTDVWYYIVGTFEFDGIGDYQGTWSTYLNGVNDQVTPNTCGEGSFDGSFDDTDKWRSGDARRWGGNSDLQIDELRISTIARDAGWILTEYNNQVNPDTFYTVNSQRDQFTEEESDKSLTIFWSDFVEMALSFGSEVTDTIIWSDNSTVTFATSLEFDDTVIWSDNTVMKFDVIQDVPDDVVIWSDFVEMVLSFGQEVTDTIIWNDDSKGTFDASQEVDDVIIWSDNSTFNIDFNQENTDDIIWSDSVEMALSFSQEVTDTIIWNDNSTGTLVASREVDDDTVKWSDFVKMAISSLAQTVNATNNFIIWSDNATIGQLDISQEPTDTVIWSDFINMTFNISLITTDTVIWTDNAGSSTDLGQLIPDEIVIWSDDTEITFDISQEPTDTVIWGDFINMTFNISLITTDTIIWSDPLGLTGSFFTEVADFVGWLDGAGQGFDPSDEPIIIINEGDTIINQGGTGSGGGVGGSTPTTPDSDGDGFLDDVDDCPNIVGTAPDGCPLVVPPVVIVPPEIELPFELTQLDVVDDNIVLDTTSAQPQVEDLTIRWLGSEPITITGVEVGDSPFEIIIEDIPVIIGSNEYGLTEYDIKYTVQEPFTLCTNDFSFDCLAEVTYDIPVIVTGEIDGRIVITEGKIRVDNSDRLNPYYLILFGIFATLFIAIAVFKKRRKTHPRFKEKTVGKNKVRMRVIENQTTPLKAGTQRSKLSMNTKLNIINPKNQKTTDTYKFIIASEKQRMEKKKKKKRNRLGF